MKLNIVACVVLALASLSPADAKPVQDGAGEWCQPKTVCKAQNVPVCPLGTCETTQRVWENPRETAHP